jgi:hypothetical protein
MQSDRRWHRPGCNLERHEPRLRGVPGLTGARVTRVAVTLAIVAGLLAVVGYVGAAAQQGDDEYRVTLGGLAKGIDHEFDDPDQGVGGAEPAPEPTPTPEPAPEPDEPAPTPDPTPVESAFPPQVEQWRPLAESLFPHERVNAVLFIIQCESNGNPNVTGAVGERGLMQIHPLYHQARADEMFGAPADLYDPYINLSVAAVLSDGGTNWRPWAWCSARLPY